MIWKPHATVAAVLEQAAILLVEEHTPQGLDVSINPPGTGEPNETLPAGAIREVLEESAYEFEAQYLIGVYRWHSNTSDTTYLRFAFGGRILAHHPGASLTKASCHAVWMTLDEIRATPDTPPHPLILRCVEITSRAKR